MRYIIILLLLVVSPLYADIAGETSIGKSEEVYRGNIKLGYDLSWEDISFIPFIDYTNYFYLSSIGGHPFQDIFGVGLKIEWKDIFFKVYHECSHAVSSKNTRDKPVLYEDAELNDSSTWVIIGIKWGKEF